ncbi:hypothetical protein PILCRDRAFT_15323 [Piloderma croceum F 1598]|uniref:Uncharacterized protein n=1 Tax=Piloderma croceum (strain F 1598) TaxID=765440 RepID=A0A0C3F059_PILCF|nr:hypothetical protein PILCRDRAFT_15323 [Piloderma croceum F 1598]
MASLYSPQPDNCHTALQIQHQISDALESVTQLRRSVENISGAISTLERNLRNILRGAADNTSSTAGSESPPLVIQPLSLPPYLKNKRSRLLRTDNVAIAVSPTPVLAGKTINLFDPTDHDST